MFLHQSFTFIWHSRPILVHSSDQTMVPKLQNTTMLLPAKLLFIFQQVDSKFDSWLFCEKENYHQGQGIRVEQIQCICTFMCIGFFTIGAWCCLYVYAWYICLATNHRFTTIRLKQP